MDESRDHLEHVGSTEPGQAATPVRRTIIRRDSLERREAFLRGKEGSRQRRRWENGKI